MKNSQKGSTLVAVLVAIIILLIVAGGYYIYKDQISKSNGAVNFQSQPIETAQQAVNKPLQSSSQSPTNISVLSANKAVSGTMQSFTDQEVGFSFWYPKNWQISRATPSRYSDSNITQGTVLASLFVGPRDDIGSTNPQIVIQEVHSSSASITDTFGTGTNQTYFFSFPTHTWMTISQGYNTLAVTSAANVSNNTMGGLHILGGVGDYNNAAIIPLSAYDFLVINKIGSYDSMLLARTVMALNPAVATPLDSDEQTKIIQDESLAYGKPLPGVTWKTYADQQTGVSFEYPSDFGGGASASVQNPGGVPKVLITPDNAVDSHGCIPSTNGNGKPGTESQLTINNIAVCLSTSEEAGMSQLYTTYSYTAHKNGEYITLQYIIHTSNGCGVFQGDPSLVSCQYFLGNFNHVVIKSLEKSVGSLALLRR